MIRTAFACLCLTFAVYGLACEVFREKRITWLDEEDR